VESSSVDSHHDPRVREEEVWLLEGFDVFIPIGVSKEIKERRWECLLGISHFGTMGLVRGVISNLGVER
jgi:hypothetical protein